MESNNYRYLILILIPWIYLLDPDPDPVDMPPWITVLGFTQELVSHRTGVHSGAVTLSLFIVIVSLSIIDRAPSVTVVHFHVSPIMSLQYCPYITIVLRIHTFFLSFFYFAFYFFKMKKQWSDIEM